jgi:hypothetical protein
VNGGRVQLIGNFKGCRIVMDETPAAA